MNFFKNLKIKNKLRVSIILQLTLLMTLIGFYFYLDGIIAREKREQEIISTGVTNIQVISVEISRYLDGKLPYDLLSKEIKSAQGYFNEHAEVFVNWEKLDGLTRLAEYLEQTDQLRQKNFLLENQLNELADQAIKQNQDYLAEISRRLVSINLRASVSDLEKQMIVNASLSVTSYYSIKSNFRELKETGDVTAMMTLLDGLITVSKNDEKRLAHTTFAKIPSKAIEVIEQCKTIVAQYVDQGNHIKTNKENILTTIDDFLKYASQYQTQAVNNKLDLMNRLMLSCLVFIGILSIIIVSVNLRSSRLITRPIAAMTERAHDLAVDDVDMTKRLEVFSNDELGELSGWFNKFLERLHALIQEVRASSEEIFHSADEIAGRTGILSTRTNEQTLSITETSAKLEQFAASVRENTENSAEADMMFMNFNQTLQEKISLIDNVTGTMTEIFTSSQQIDHIIKVINDISFQTNLLALNAAVEAARAGEAGRGFAVVAAEVRNLAQKTAISSKSIQDIVMRNVESTQRGMDLVKETSEFFGEIVGVMGDIVTKISNITNVSQEQANSIKHINHTTNQMMGVSQQNSSLVRELSEIGQDVRTYATEMQRLVSQFKLATVKKTDTAVKSNKKTIVPAPTRSTPAKPQPHHTVSAAASKKMPPVQTGKGPGNKNPSSNEDFFSPIGDGEGFEEF